MSTHICEEHNVEGLDEDIMTHFAPIDVNADQQTLDHEPGSAVDLSNNLKNSENVQYGKNVYDIEEEDTHSAQSAA